MFTIIVEYFMDFINDFRNSKFRTKESRKGKDADLQILLCLAF